MQIIQLSVVIPTMNRPKSLKDTIFSFLSGSKVPDEIVIVDQSLNDDTEKMLHIIKQDFQEINFLYLKLEKPSLTKARNMGLDFCTNDIIIFSDDDIEIYEDTINNVYMLMKQDNVAIVGALDDNSNYKSSILGYFAGINSFQKRHIGYVSKSCFGKYPTSFNECTKTEWCMGYFFSIKKSLSDKWKIKWDENLVSYAYAEDLDFTYSYCRMSKKNGLDCLLTKMVHVKHNVSKEYRIPNRKQTFMLVLHRYYLIQKLHMGIFSFIQASYANIAIFFERCIKKEKPYDVIEAIYTYLKNKKNIDNGNIEPFLS